MAEGAALAPLSKAKGRTAFTAIPNTIHNDEAGRKIHPDFGWLAAAHNHPPYIAPNGSHAGKVASQENRRAVC